MMRPLVLGAIAMIFATAAHALAVVEFLKMDVSQQMDVIKPIQISFLQSGYRKVPDNSYGLALEVKKIAFEKGYTYQSIEEVAKEAAIRMGMTR